MSSEVGSNSSAGHVSRRSYSWLTYFSEDEIYEKFEELHSLIPGTAHPDQFDIEYLGEEGTHPNEVNIKYQEEWPNIDIISTKLREQTKAPRDFLKQEVVHLHGLLAELANEVDESLGVEVDRADYDENSVDPTDVHKGVYKHERAVKKLAPEVLPTDEWPIYHQAAAQSRSWRGYHRTSRRWFS
ncbi:MAG: UPF0058 family protein [Candidatus Nanohaloarchaea archaeon]